MNGERPDGDVVAPDSAPEDRIVDIDVVDSWVPDACTLPSEDRPTRVGEFDQLFGSVRALDRVGPDRLTLWLDPEPAVAARSAELAVRETGCCSFFTFTQVIGDGQVRLEISVPVARSDVLDGIQTRVAASTE